MFPKTDASPTGTVLSGWIAPSGLSAGTGFGYLVLFKECRSKKSAFKIVLCTYLVSVAAGMIIHLAML